jgi:hypothetical protein
MTDTVDKSGYIYKGQYYVITSTGTSTVGVIQE